MAKGNPGWGMPEMLTMAPPTLTEFERTVRRLKLKPHQYVSSEELRAWVVRNSHSRYVPESLLRAWGVKVRVAVHD